MSPEKCEVNEISAGHANGILSSGEDGAITCWASSQGSIDNNAFCDELSNNKVKYNARMNFVVHFFTS